MPNYRRLYVPGGTYFFTVNLLDRRQNLLTRHIDDLRAAYGTIAKELPFETVAIVILPDHLHCLWSLPPGDADFSTRWKRIKREFSVRLPRDADANTPRRDAERGIWQRRFWEHCIRNDDDFSRHVDYIHFNPVKHGHAANPDDWPYSSWHEWKREFGRPINTPPDDWSPAHLGER